jgi:large subunit ribosomal protein L35
MFTDPTPAAGLSEKTPDPPKENKRRQITRAHTTSVPFDELPYQCFQEARKILVADRAEKLKQIETERARIERLKATDPSNFRGGQAYKERRIRDMQGTLEKLKIFADINDPNVKRRFEDGLGKTRRMVYTQYLLNITGDMNKPISRHLAEKKWQSYERKIQVQRIEQFKIVPDVIPQCDPILDIHARFLRKKFTSGDIITSDISEKQPPSFTIQMFSRGEKLLTIVAIDPDIPNLETDKFDSRCHFLATNIRITPTSPAVNLSSLSPDQVVLPWQAPTAQKGSPYHRICFAVFEQKDNSPIDHAGARKWARRDRLSPRALMKAYSLTPVGASLFRTQWDEHMADVMARNKVPGADIELKRKKVEPLPYKRRNPPSFR